MAEDRFGELGKFKSVFREGVRKNRFLIDFKYTGTFGLTPNYTSDLKWLVQGSSLPGQKVNDIEVSWQGLKTSYAGDPETNVDWKCNFFNDKEQRAYKYIDAWLNLKANPASNTRGLATDYQRKILVYQLNENGDKMCAYVLHNAHPNDLPEGARDNEPTTSWEQMDVSFKYDFRTYIADANDTDAINVALKLSEFTYAK